MATKFRLGGGLQKRLTQFSRDDSWGLRDQIHLCDTLLEQAVKDGSNSLANSLLVTRAKLLTASIDALKKKNELLDKGTVSAYLAAAVAIFIKHIKASPLTAAQRDQLLDTIHAELGTLPDPENNQEIK